MTTLGRCMSFTNPAEAGLASGTLGMQEAGAAFSHGKATLSSVKATGTPSRDLLCHNSKLAFAIHKRATKAILLHPYDDGFALPNLA